MDPHLIPVAIAVGTVIVVPSIMWLGKRIAKAWNDHRVEVLSETFVSRKEVEVQFSQLAEVQARQHAENQRVLEAIRLDGKEGEGRVTAMIGDMRDEVRDGAKDLRKSVSEVHRRVDSVLGMLGNRRQQ